LGPGRIITADGECQASKRLAMAANVMARDPAALQLRLLQIVVEVAGEQNSTLVMPVPVELLRFFEKMTPAGPAAELSRSLADFGDAEPAEAEAAIEGRPSAAGSDAVPPVDAVTMAPVEAPDITVPRSLRTLSKPNGRSRRLQGHGEQAQPGLESGAGLMLPGPGSDPPGLRPPPEAATTALPEPACTTVPVSAQQLSQRRAGRTGPGSFSAGGDSTGQPRFLVLPLRGTGGAGIAVSDRDCQRPGGDHRASLILCWQRRGGPAGHGRDLAARCPDGGRAMMVCWRLDQGQDQGGCVRPRRAGCHMY
jgi:hypothetical protein